jgi:tetratricopeptide (TPR) repeat protein
MASEVIDRARASYRERAWAAAYADFHAADDESPLAIDDLEQLAVTAYLIAKDDDSLELWARAHRECLRLDDAERAARCGFWLAFHLLLRGDIARSGGWVARIQRLLDDRQLDCAVQGYVMVVNGLVALDADDVDHAYALFTRATDIADRFTDPDLSAIARLSTGEALIQRHEVAQGVRLLDEVMAGVITDEVSPVVIGVLYCATILCCQKIFDIRRETEWTAALTDWCAAQPDLVPFRGQCLVHVAGGLLRVLERTAYGRPIRDIRAPESGIRRMADQRRSDPGYRGVALPGVRGEPHRYRRHLSKDACSRPGLRRARRREPARITVLRRSGA